MNEKNIIRCIKELQERINTLEELDANEEYTNYSKSQIKDIIDRNNKLKKIYILSLVYYV